MNPGQAEAAAPIPYHERLTFVWIASGPHGEPKAAFAIDGRDYADAEQARTAVREALERTDLRVRVADYRSVRISENEKEAAYWPSWDDFRGLLDVYGPVDPWRRPALRARACPSAATLPVAVSRTPLYSSRHFECWGQLVVVFPAGEGPDDPILGRPAEGYGLNGYTGEFEPDTRRALQCAHGLEDDETWPLRDEDDFIAAVEERREQLLRASFYQRHDKPEIFAAYQRAAQGGRTVQNRRATCEMWRHVHRRRAFFLVGTEPVRVDLSDDGTPMTAWRLDPTTGRIVATGRADAVTVEGRRITEHAWLLAVEDRRRTLDVHGAIAETYAKAAEIPDEVYRRSLLTRSFDLWAEQFANEATVREADLHNNS
ncbi:hypothetical protein LUW74_44730 [Actinomadura madurae]|uniref:hypothetical protein n=1 Tax=Actinomadura madurae TaxID=1993 RepID=UPI0020261EAE|nr:hypothetical protein [Actinomadura madurae]URN09761.1 hypothetical protein LUW74_44730 [Actinomadura madurae]